VQRFLLVVLGGGFGSGARYVVGQWVTQLMQRPFPFGTLVINAAGSFLISLIMYLSLEANLIGPEMRLLLTTGVMGGFTTYSTFNYETLAFLQSGAWLMGALNLVGTVVLCLISGTLGLAVARWIIAQPWAPSASF
jgi:fluoride exporter